MVYRVFKFIAILNIIVHVVLTWMSVTDRFNIVFITLSVIVLFLPNKYWGIYILPMLIILAGLIVGGYLLSMRWIA